MDLQPRPFHRMNLPLYRAAGHMQRTAAVSCTCLRAQACSERMWAEKRGKRRRIRRAADPIWGSNGRAEEEKKKRRRKQTIKKDEPISLEHGKEIERALRGTEWENNIAMRVHTVLEDYMKFLAFFETPEEYVFWHKYFLIENPELNKLDPRTVSYRALILALRKLEPDLGEAESNRVQLEMLKQKQRQIDLQKHVFQGQVVAHYSSIAELLKLPDTLIEMLREKKKTVIEQVEMDRVDMEEVLKIMIKNAMKKGHDRLKDVAIEGKMMDIQETNKEVAMYVWGSRNRKNFKYVLLQIYT